MRDFIYCLIFPHPSNNHRARILHPKILILLIAFFLASSLFSSKLNPFSSRTFADVTIQELVDSTNAARGQNGLSPLTLNDLLSVSASRKADDMFAKNYWAHFSPDGVSPWFFIKDSGYEYVYAGENLARGFNSASEVVSAWMASPTHRENILSKNFTEVGFSIKGGQLQGENTILIVQHFGSRVAAVQEQPVQETVVNNPTPEPVPTESPGTFVVQPTLSPTPVDEPSPTQALTLTLTRGLTNSPVLDVSSRVAILVVLLILTVFLIDLFIVDRKRVVRFVGHNVDHVLYFGVILIIVIVLNLGSIL